MIKVDKKNRKNALGTKFNNNVTMIAGQSYATFENYDDLKDAAAINSNEAGTSVGIVDRIIRSSNSDGSSDHVHGDSAYDSENVGINRKFIGVEKDTIDTMFRSNNRFLKWCQLKTHMAGNLQHVATFSSDNDLMRSVAANGIKNNPLSKKDVDISKNMLGPRNYAAKENIQKYT